MSTKLATIDSPVHGDRRACFCYNPPVPKRQLAILALISAASLWGSAFVATKVAVVEFQPFTLALVRFVLASAILLPIAHYQWRRTTERIPLPWSALALLGLFGVTLFYASFNLGMAHTTATKGSLIHGAIPALTALAAIIVLRERPSLINVVGIALSIGGVVVIVGIGSNDLAGGTLLGDALVLVSALVWTAFTVLGKRIGPQIPSVIATAYTSLFGMIFLIPFAGYEAATTSIGPVTPLGLLALAYLTLGSSAAAFFLWTFSLSHLSASQVGVFMNFVPVTGVATAVILLGEPLLPTQVIGGALVLIGVYFANREPAAVQRPTRVGGA